MLVGDSLTADIAGGRASGMQTCWFCQDDEKWKNEEAERIRQEHGADYVIRHLDELRNIL